MIITRGFSLTNFVIGTSALSFQVWVLYPWHKQLDDDFHRMNEKHAEMMRQGEEARLVELRKIQDELAMLQKQKRSWFF